MAKNWQKELDEYLARAAKKAHVSDKRIIAITNRNTEEYRKKLSQSTKGIPKTQDHIEKRKLSMPDQSGKNNPFYGKSHSLESKLKISGSRKGIPAHNKGKSHDEVALEKMRKPRSEEGKANMRKPRTKMLTCPHCNKTGAAGNMSRYHMDNCKFKGA